MTEDQLNTWISLNVTKVLRRLTDEEYESVVALCEEANSEPHPNLYLTTPWRYVGTRPDYTSKPGLAMQVLKHCMTNLDKLTGRTDFQIVVFFDEGCDEPWCVITDSVKEEDEKIHGKNLASAPSIELAICRFCKNLYDNRTILPPSQTPA